MIVEGDLEMKHTCTRSLSDDFDKLNPCFFENETEQMKYDTPAPSEDIWKKFELLPTPPRSPKHEANYNLTVSSSTLEKLQLVSDLLEEPLSDMDYSMFPEDCAVCNILAPEECILKSNSSLKSNLIQDCMWSGLNLAKDLKVELKSTETQVEKPTNTTASTNSSSNSNSLSSSLDMASTTDCVDPTAVFPYPLNDTREQNLGAETPSDSEDEEIDVVTVNDKVQITRRKPFLPAAPTMSAQVAAMHNYTAPAPASPKARPVVHSSAPSSPSSPPRSNSHHHSGSHKRGRPSSSPRHNHPPIKKIKINLPNQSVSIVSKPRHYHRHHASSAGSRSSSDSEDSDCRRSQHNILERKRRNDLKYSFHSLRDHVPELHTQERAPKVVILKKATDYIHQLRRTEKSLESELERQKQRRDQLKRRLNALHRM